MLTEINNNWLGVELKQFDCNENLQQATILFKERVKEALTNSLLKSKWKLEDFLLLIIACNMDEEFCTTCNMQPCVDLTRRALGEYCIYPLTQWNVFEIKQRLNQYHIHALALLKQIQKNRYIPVEVSPIEWLELVESIGEELFIPSVEKFFYEVIWPTSPEPGIYLPPKTVERIESSKRSPIVTLMAELIRFHHYGIDPELAKTGYLLVERLNIAEAANLLNVSVDEILRRCLLGEFGAYLKARAFKVRRTTHSPITRELIELRAKDSFSYPYDGLVRLYTTSEAYPKACMKQLFDGGEIVAPDVLYAGVPLQPSLSECVQGITKCIALRRGQKITVNDLVFIKMEIDDIKNRENNSYSLGATNSTEAHSSEEDSNGAYGFQIIEKSHFLTGKHHRDKRELVLKHVIAAILSGKTRVSCAQSIVNGLKIEEKTIENKGKIREINRYLKHPLDFNKRENRSEKLHGIILYNAFQLKNKSVTDKSKHIENVFDTSKTMAEALGISEASEELNKILSEAAAITLASYA